MKTSKSYAADKSRLLTRLRRIEGQARGLAKMVEEDRYCIDIMQQIASMRAAADAVALVLLRDHLDGCVREAVQDERGRRRLTRWSRRSGGTAGAEASYAPPGTRSNRDAADTLTRVASAGIHRRCNRRLHGLPSRPWPHSP